MDEKPQWLIQLESLRREIQESNRQQESKIRPPKTPYCERQEKVVKGIIEWEPIDKTAALVVSQAPWWAHYDEKKTTSESQTSDTNKIRKSKTKTSDSCNPIRKGTQKTMKPQLQHNPRQGPLDEGGPHIYKGPDGQDLIKPEEFVPAMIAELNKHPQELTVLARAAVDARGVMMESMDKVGFVLDEFKTKSKSLLEDVRQTRFAVVAETTQMINPLRELRQFFLGKDYEEEIKRLREFVELCERLSVLKRDGSLDAIADTMVKLAVS